MMVSEVYETEYDSDRKPVQTPYMRRDSIYNPEYLDAERALVRFAPLIESIVRQLRTWYSRFDNEQDIEDLRSFIQSEFLLLHYRYDPSYGVDFPGYIKMNLARRVRYYVNRNNKRLGQEVLTFASDITGNYMESIADDRAYGDLERVDCVLSIPLEKIEDEACRELVSRIVVGKKNLYELAEEYGVSPRSMQLRIEAAGRYVRAVLEEEDVTEEDFEDLFAGLDDDCLDRLYVPDDADDDDDESVLRFLFGTENLDDDDKEDGICGRL